MFKDLNWRLIVLGVILCAVATAAYPYVTLKLGMGVDLSMGAMFVAMYVLGQNTKGKKLAIQLNIIQSMIGTVCGIGFMVVIQSAFFYIKNVFELDINFDPTPFQMFVWLLVSANIGVFMGVLARHTILKDRSLPWPTARATLSVAETLSDPAATDVAKKRRDVLTASTGVAGFLTFLKDGVKSGFGLELLAIGVGMLLPLSVGLSGLLGTWGVHAFGDKVSQYAAIAGTIEENEDRCLKEIDGLKKLKGEKRNNAIEFLKTNCGTIRIALSDEAKKADPKPQNLEPCQKNIRILNTLPKDSREERAIAFNFLNAECKDITTKRYSVMEYVESPGNFKLVVQWMMWPATALMIAAAITGVAISMVRARRRKTSAKIAEASLADEEVPLWLTILGLTVSVLLMALLTNIWFGMPWSQIMLAVAIQSILIIAGLRVLGITGNGPISLLANATQFLYGIFWPAQIQNNLVAAYISANPQAAAENIVPSFWVSQRLGGRFATLVIAQLIVVPIGALLTPIVFNILQETYGIGLGEGQLAAPTGLKIATLAMVMQQGLSALPRGALVASLVAIVVGVIFESLLAVCKTDADGNETQRFPWIPIPSALGFALILPSSLMIGMACGSVISAVWKKFSTAKDGSYERFATPLASGMIAGEAIVGSILLPAIALFLTMLGLK